MSVQEVMLDSELNSDEMFSTGREDDPSQMNENGLSKNNTVCLCLLSKVHTEKYVPFQNVLT